MDRKSFLGRMAAGALACALLELEPIAEPVETEPTVTDLSFIREDMIPAYSEVFEGLEPDSEYIVRARFLYPDGSRSEWAEAEERLRTGKLPPGEGADPNLFIREFERRIRERSEVEFRAIMRGDFPPDSPGPDRSRST